MKANVTVSNSTDTIGRRQSHAATFSKVLDGRKQPIRGLWERNGRYYAQITLENRRNETAQNQHGETPTLYN